MGTVWFNGCRIIATQIWMEGNATETPGIAALTTEARTIDTFLVHEADAAAGGTPAPSPIPPEEGAVHELESSVALANFRYH